VVSNHLPDCNSSIYRRIPLRQGIDIYRVMD
jgi:hypothetical protein